MNNVKVVLFDLDGTLLPMDLDVFTKAYFEGLVRALLPYGYDATRLSASIWEGTKAMIKNDGTRLNETAFWEKFVEINGTDAEGAKPILQKFYEERFDNVKESCGFNPDAAKLVSRIKSMGYRVALATNPLFPSIATEKRIAWAGLSPSDFELYTTYENSRYTKPHLEYYREVLKKLSVNAEDCIMVGNDVSEDMVAGKLGMKTFLLTDNLINKNNEDISVYPHGGFAELISILAQ